MAENPVVEVAALNEPEPIPSLFLKRATEHPDRVATHSKVDGVWLGSTWAEVKAAVEQVALGLLELGVDAGETVAIVSNTRREWSQADMAILSVGGITVGLYPTLTDEQAAYILRHGEVRFAFVEDEVQARKISPVIHGSGGKIVGFGPSGAEGAGPIDLDLEGLRALGRDRASRQPDEFEARISALKASDVATYVYTSGTTGEPKGAMLTHANFHYVIHATLSVMPYDDEVTLAFLPLAHSLQRYANYLALVADVSGYYAESFEKLPENILEVRPTAFATVPRVLEKIYAKAMARGAEAGGFKAEVFERSLGALRRRGEARRKATTAGFRTRVKARIADRLVGERIRERLGGRINFLGCGGAPLNPEVQRFFEDLGIPILEGWGLTETSAPVCINTMTNRRIGTVGRPLPGSEVRIADDGEILVRGPGVFSGYYKDEVATAAAFDDEGWFRTGDLGAISRDGFLSITGRKKDLIITAGGKNIAPQPIERSIACSPLVSQVVVVGDAKPFLGALITLDPEVVRQESARLGLRADQPLEALVTNPAIRGLVDRVVAETNSHLARYEQVKRWALLTRELSIEAGEMTPTLKIKRRVVSERYATEIDSLYAS